MMAKVSFLLGLCGSGKSHLAEDIVHRTGAKYIDSLLAEPSRMSLLFEILTRGEDCVVEEAAFCTEEGRSQIVKALARIPSVEVEWICFENNVESANWNVRHRLNKGDALGHLEINRRLSIVYTYPSGTVPRPIYRIPGR